MKHERLARLALIFCLGLIASCGRQSELSLNNSDQLNSALANKLGTTSPIANSTFQQELQLVMGEVQSAVATALLPSFKPTMLATAATPAAACKPTFSVVLIGVSIAFAPGAGCVLSGTVDVKLFPPTVDINLQATGLTFVNKVAISGTYALGGNGSLNMSFLGGQLSLNQVPGFDLGSVALNGEASMTLSPALKFTARLNAFSTTSAMGVALMSTIDTSASVSNIQGCILTGGDPQNPQAGSASPCFGI